MTHWITSKAATQTRPLDRTSNRDDYELSAARKAQIRDQRLAKARQAKINTLCTRCYSTHNGEC